MIFMYVPIVVAEILAIGLKGSFSTDCDIADEALSHDFDTLDNNDLVVDASCWSVVNQGDANTWGLLCRILLLLIYIGG